MENDESINIMIKRAQRNLICPLCKKHYLPEEIKLRGFFDELFIFQTKCQKFHPPVVSIFITAYSNQTTINARPKQYYHEHEEIIPSRIIQNIHRQIEEFDGDFLKLWKK